MQGQIHRLLTILLLIATGMLGPVRVPHVVAQESDTNVPIVQMGGTVHGDLFTGQATLSVPLTVLPGRQGLQPELALVYGSANGNGWVGMGWKLEKGVIERNLKFGVDYTADDYVFRLNGVNVELVNIGGDEYRAKIEGGFMRIQKKSGAAGPYFEAADRYGTRYIFGETARVADPEDSTRVFRWCLERVEDPNGNYMEFTYESFEDDNQAYLKTIAYTGHEGEGLAPTTTVAFELEDEDRPDAPTLYTTHFPMRTSKRLKKIVMTAPSGEVMRSYQLAYHTTLSSSGRSLLQSVTECGRPRDNGDGTVTETCLPAQTFTYTKPTGLTYSESLASLPFQGKSCEDNPPDPACSGRSWVPQGPLGPSDVDGNGRLQLLAFNDSTVIASDPPTEPDPDGTFPLDHMNCELSGPNVGAGAICTWNYDSTNSFPDIEFPEGTVYQWGPTTYLGSSDLVHGSMGYQLDEGPTAFADITGDGAMEVYQWTFDGGIDLHIPQVASDRRSLAGWSTVPDVLTWETFTAETPPKELVYRLGFADVDGDGQADFWGRQGNTVLVRLAHDYDPQTQTQTFAPAQALLWADIGPLGNPMGFVDVNNDGRADFWGVRADEDLEIRLSKGDGTLGAPVIFPWVNDPLMNDPSPTARALRRAPPLGFADINGDGLADFWGWAPATKGPYVGGHLYYALGQGDGSFGAPDSLFWESPPPNGPLSNDPAVLRNPGGRLGFADLNGDGKADVYGWKHGDDHITYHLTQANGTVSDVAQTFSWSGSTPNAGPIGFADITGDGLPEFYGWTDAGWNGQVNIVGVSEAKPDLLITVENGIGGRWDLTYASTGEPDLSGDQTQLPFTMPVVEAITVDDGNGNVGLITYARTGGYYHIAERDFRGFHYARKTGPIHPDPYNPPEPSIEQKTWFHQGNDVAVGDNAPNVPDGYLKGAPYRQTVAGVDNGVLYSQTETIYTPDDDGPPFFTPPQSQQTWTCGENGLCRVMQTEFVYDAYGNVTQEIHHGDLAVGGDERTVERNFVPNGGAWIVGLPASEILYVGVGTGSRVAQTDFLYDGSSGSPTKGNLTQEVRWHDRGSDVTTVWTYDTLGNVLTIQDAQGSTTTRTYDASRTFVVTETNAVGHTSQTAYYGVNGHPIDQGLYGQRKQVTDPNGNFTTTTYDRLGRPERVVHQDGLFTETAYLNFGQGVNTQHVQTYHEVSNAPTDDVYPNSPWGVLSKQYFDGLGRIIQDEQPGVGLNFESITEVEYDYRGHRTSRSLPHFRVNPNPNIPFPVITYETDALGRVVQATYPDTHVEKTCYGAGVTVSLDGNNHQTRIVRDAYGQVVTVQEYDGEFGDCSTGAGSPYSTTHYTYDVLGNLTKVRDAQGNETTMVYDSLSRKIQMDDPDMGRWTYAYDVVGNLTQQTDAKGQSIHFQYDTLHRRVQKDYDAPKALGSGDVIWSYDRLDGYGLGRLTSLYTNAAAIPSATELWYDKRGRVAKKAETIGAHTFTTEMTHDGLDREKARTFPDGSVVQKTYTGQHIWRVEEGDGYRYAEITGYTPMAQPLLRRTGDGITTTYGYRSDNFRLQSLVSEGSATLQNLTYSYDNGGNVVRITDPRHGDQTFVYDALNRLRRATVGGEEIHYTYSPIGNLLSHSGIGNYTYNPSGPSSVRPHAVRTAGPYTYRYDANGNLTSGANRSIEYDHDNRPITITSTGYGGSPVAPTITTPPADRTVFKGGPATFTVSATGTAPLSYQWRRDGVDIPGAIGTSYRLPSTTENDSGAVFTVEVKNPAGTVTSAGATLTVVPTYPLTVTMEGSGRGTVTSNPSGLSCSSTCSQTFSQGTAVTLTAAPQPGMTFRGWNGGGCSGAGNCVVTMDQAQHVTATFGRFLASWPLEGDASDASGQGQDGVLIGTPLTVPGQLGQALEFDGNQEYVSLPTGSLTANQSEVTLALWVKPEAWGNMMVLYAEDLREGTFPLETFNGQFAIRPSGWVTRDTTTGTTGTPNNTLTLPDLNGAFGAWHHMTFVYSVKGQRKAIYLDGTLVNATSVSIDPLTGSRNDAALGSSSSVGAFWGGDGSTRYHGALDEVHLFDHALTDAEIAVLAGSTPPSGTAPAITTQPQNVTVTEPNAATFDVLASGTAPLSYQWRRNGTNIAGATSASYTLNPTAPPNSGATFAVVVSNSAGSVTSASATLTVHARPIEAFYQARGGDHLVSLEAEHYHTHTPNGGNQWTTLTFSGASGEEGVEATPDIGTLRREIGEVGQSPRLDYRVHFVTTGTHYVWVRGAGPNHTGDSLHIGLDGVAFTTSDKLSNFGTSWTWSRQTMEGSSTEGPVATIDVPTVGEHTLNLWMREDGVQVDKLVLTTTGYTPTGTGPAESGNTPPTAMAPSITAQPKNVTVTDPNAATFSVVASGTAPLSYQWRRDGATIAGATSASYTLNPTAPGDSEATFAVVVSNSAGSVTSTTAILTVEPEVDPPSITTQPLNVSLTEPAGAMFTVAATGTPPLSYQWRRNGVAIEGGTYANYMVSSTTTSDSGDAIDVVVSNTAGSVTSVLVTLTVGPEPTRVLVPNVIGQAEAAAESTLGGGGLLVGPITYQASGSVPAGVVISQEPTADTEVPEGKRVDLVVSLGPTPPDPAGPPRIIRQPGDVKVEAPDGAIFRVEATGAEPLSYQWRQNGWNIEGATSARYVLPTARGEDNGGTFEVVVSNAQGSVTSRVATLLVKSIPSAFPLTVTLAGTGNGTVTSDPAGINCGITCTHVFNSDILVTLTAAPSSFFDTFIGWSGGGCAGSLPCEVTLTQAKTVTATFNNWLFGATPLEEPGGSIHLVRSRSVGNSPLATPDAGQVVDAPRHTAYLHLAAFRTSVQTMPWAMEQVTETEGAQQRQLKQILVRTQAAPSEATVTTFVYNGEAQRIIKQVDDWVTIYIGQHYVCHGTEYAVRNGGELACAKLIYVNGQRVAMVQVDTGRATYFHADHLGSSRVITNETGTIEQELAYYPFGQTRVNSSSQNVDLAYKYTGQELDDTTGLYDYHARLYDPTLGRFISADTIVPDPGNPQDLNRYSYVRNNPLAYVDPNGEFAVSALYRFLYGGSVGAFSAYVASEAQGASLFGNLASVGLGFVSGGIVGLAFPNLSDEIGTTLGNITAAGIAGTSNLAGQYLGNQVATIDQNVENELPTFQNITALSGLKEINFGSAIFASGTAPLGVFAGSNATNLILRSPYFLSGHISQFGAKLAGNLVTDLIGGGASLIGVRLGIPSFDFSTWPPTIIRPGLPPIERMALLDNNFLQDTFNIRSFTSYDSYLYHNFFSDPSSPTVD